MLALGIDTSSLSGSVGLADDAGLVAELSPSSTTTHSSRLLPSVQSLLSREGRSLDDVDLLAVATGPGSFTGLRIGMATAKGLSLAMGRPLVGFSTLETMAVACVAPFTERRAAVICIMLDAGRGEVYRGLFRCEKGRVATLEPEAALSPEEAASGLPEGCLVLGDGLQKYADIMRPLVGAAVLGGVGPAIGSTLARRALSLAAERGVDHLEAPAPNYLRLSDAERSARRR